MSELVSGVSGRNTDERGAALQRAAIKGVVVPEELMPDYDMLICIHLY